LDADYAEDTEIHGRQFHLCISAPKLFILHPGRKITNRQSQIRFSKAYPDPLKTIIIGDWRMVICYLKAVAILVDVVGDVV
jgi:hypothetical protein